MVLLGYFYREAREAVSLDAAWQYASDTLSWSRGPAQKSSGVSNKSTTDLPATKATPDARPALSRASTASSSTSEFPSLTRQRTTNLSNTGTLSDGSIFSFTENEREVAQAQLNAIASGQSSSGYAGYTSYVSTSALSSLGSAVIGTAALKTGLGNRGRGRYTGAGSASVASSVSSRSGSPEYKPRGRSSSVWSRGSSASSVTSRGGRNHVKCDDW